MDGKQVNSSPKKKRWKPIYHLSPIPSNTKVIAVSITNLVGSAGFRAAFSDSSVVSDGSWKCSSTFKMGWQNVDFNANLWPAPATTGISASCKAFPSSAKYLWADKHYKSVTTIYCRKTLSIKLALFSYQHDVLYIHACRWQILY